MFKKIAKWFGMNVLDRRVHDDRCIPLRNVTFDTRNYKVTWAIDIYADSHAEAAEKALAIQRDKHSLATFFTVRNTDTGETVEIDIEPIYEGGTA